MTGRIVIIGSFAESFLDFRGNLTLCMIKHGYEVHVLLPACSSTISEPIRSLGVTLHQYDIDRAGKNPLSDLRSIWSIRALLVKIRPTHVFSYTVKPVMYSNIALFTISLPIRSFALITGLGHLFTATGLKRKLANQLIKVPYCLSLKRCEKLIFQNPDDQQLFINNRTANSENTLVVSGSGVDLEHYSVVPLPDQPSFLMIARLLGDKGINEYFDAAQSIRRRWPEARFHLLGYLDENPSTLTDAQLHDGLQRSGVEFHGKTDDVRPYISRSSVFVLPSYREGLPRTILEAMAMGRAIITTDAPGCRETVIDGKNGYLVEPRSAADLISAMQRILEQPDRVLAMGLASRDLACSKFDDAIVNNIIVGALA